MNPTDEWEDQLKDDFLTRVRECQDKGETEFHINESELNTLWLASEEEKVESGRQLFFSWSGFYDFLRQNLPGWHLHSLEELNTKTRYHREMVLRYSG